MITFAELSAPHWVTFEVMLHLCGYLRNGGILQTAHVKQFQGTVKCLSVQIQESLKFSASLTFGSVVSVAGFVAAMSEPC